MTAVVVWLLATLAAIIAAGEPWAYPIMFASFLLAGAIIEATNWWSRRNVE